jgi:YidC/Oxa1 family membrane protein insertase
VKKEGIGLSDDNVVAPAGKTTTIGSVLYVGPELTENISHLAKGLDRTVDYGWLWFISIG